MHFGPLYWTGWKDKLKVLPKIIADMLKAMNRLPTKKTEDELIWSAFFFSYIFMGWGGSLCNWLCLLCYK